MYTDDLYTTSFQQVDVLKEILYANICDIVHCQCRKEETEIHFKVKSHEIQVCVIYYQKQYETKTHISRSEAMCNHKFAWKYDWAYKMKALFAKKIYYSTGLQNSGIRRDLRCYATAQ